MTNVVLEIGNVMSRIVGGLHDEAIDEIKMSCSFLEEVAGAGGRKTKQWHSLYNSFNNEFPTGLHRRVCNTLKGLEYKVKIRDIRTKVDIDVDSIIKRMEEFGLALRDYQIEGGLAGLEQSHGLYNWSTGAGKTVLFIFLLVAYDLPTLILVNRKELMEQIASEISSITGRSVGMIGDGIFNPSKWTVAIVNSLNKGINSPSIGTRAKFLHFLDKIRMFIGDEVHHLGAKSWKDIARACKNASVRFGFSGTCFHPDSQDIYLVAYTGEIISDISPSFLIKDGWLAQPKIYMPHLKHSGIGLPRRIGSDWHAVRKHYMRENEVVNESGVRFIKKMYDSNVSCIYFTGEDVKFGENIHKMLIDCGVHYKDIKFMTGKETTEVRRTALKDFKERRIQILGGTSIYDEGIDVPHTGAGANFGQGFSEIKTVQRIGRVLRKTKSKNSIDVDPGEKQIKYYWDPYNTSNAITEKHSEFRKQIYAKQSEFRLYEKEGPKRSPT